MIDKMGNALRREWPLLAFGFDLTRRIFTGRMYPQLREGEQRLQVASHQSVVMAEKTCAVEQARKKCEDDLAQVRLEHKAHIDQCNQTIKQLRSEMDEKERRILEEQDESRKLKDRVQALQLTTESEHEVMRSELARRDDDVSRYKIKHLNLDEKISHLESEVKRLRKGETRAQQQHAVAVREIDVKNDEISQLRTELQDTRRLCMRSEDEMQHSKQQMEGMKVEYEKNEASLDDALCSLQSANVKNDKLKTELAMLQSQQKDLLKRLSSRDDMLHKVTVEATRLKEKYRHAMTQCGQNVELIRMLEEELAKWKVDADENSRKSHDKQVEMETAMEELRKSRDEHKRNLDEKQKTCRMQEKQLETMKESAQTQCDKIQDNIRELQQLRDFKHEMELNATVVNEKYKTAQEEVNNLNTEVIQLRGELNSTCERNKVLKEEIDSHIRKMEGMKSAHEQDKSEIRNKELQLEKMELQMNHREKEHELARRKLTETEDQLKSANSRSEQLNAEVENLRKVFDASLLTSEADLSKLKQEYEVLQSSYEQKGKEIQHLSSENSDLKSSLYKLQADQQIVIDELRQSEKKLWESREEANNMTRRYDDVTAQLTSLRTQHDDVMQQFTRMKVEVEKKDEENVDARKKIASQQQEITGVCEEMRSKDDLIDKITDQLTSAQEEVEQRKHDMGTCEDVIENLTCELEKCQGDNKQLTCRVQQLRDDNDIATRQIAQHQDQVRQLEESLCKTKSDHEQFKAYHCHSNDEFIEKMEEKTTMEAEMGKLRAVVEDQQLECEHLHQQLAKLKSELDEHEMRRRDRETELGCLEHELMKSQNFIDSYEQQLAAAVDQEKAKTALASRQLEQEKRMKEALTEELMERDSLLKKLRTDLSVCHNNISQKNEKVDELEEKCTTLKAEVERVVASNATLQSRNSDLQHQLDDISSTLDETRSVYRKSVQDVSAT